jgi:5-methylcytosine-specific restriction endonuclease McrA
MLGDGRLHLSGIAKLAPLLTEDNRETLLNRAANKSKRQIEELVAELSPKPDVPTTIRKLPERRGKTKPTQIAELGPDRVNSVSRQHNPEVEAQPSPASPRPAVVKPIAPARYQIQFTASAELRDKLERLRALMRSSVNDGDLAAIIEDAVTEKLERLEAKRFGKTKAPRKSLEETDTSPSSRYIPAPVKRAVYERDLGQCCYVDEGGRRCTERNRLEFHHDSPYGRGGNHNPENVRLLCRTHNLYLAERDYGKEVMERYRSSPSRVSEPAAVYTFSNRDTRARRGEPAALSPAAFAASNARMQSLTP